VWQKLSRVLPGAAGRLTLSDASEALLVRGCRRSASLVITSSDSVCESCLGCLLACLGDGSGGTATSGCVIGRENDRVSMKLNVWSHVSAYRQQAAKVLRWRLHSICGAHLIQCFLEPHESPTQTGPRSVQQILQAATPGTLQTDTPCHRNTSSNNPAQSTWR